MHNTTEAKIVVEVAHCCSNSDFPEEATTKEDLAEAAPRGSSRPIHGSRLKTCL
jgi:hypothetical protein